MKITIDYEVNNCKDCPYLTTGRTFGNDGRDGSIVYKCKKGIFGGKCDFGYDTGLYIIPKVPPYGCPYIKVEAIDRIASKLNIDVNKLVKILDEENCSLIDKSN